MASSRVPTILPIVSSGRVWHAGIWVSRRLRIGAGAIGAEPGDRIGLSERGSVNSVARGMLLGAVDGYGCSEVDGLGSFWLAGCQTQAR